MFIKQWYFLFFILFSCSPKPESFQELIEQLTLSEKIQMIHASSSFTSGGVERLNIPELVMSDGPYGVRVEHGRDYTRVKDFDDQATYLPKCITLGATWNKSLGVAYGKVLGAEAAERGKDIILGPGINIIRSPLNGRNFEYLSEDPYLTKQMGAGYILGVQSQGVGACAKHFVANNQETWRHDVNVNMSERALREIYFPAFKTAVQEADVYTVMGAYNKFRGTHASHHHYLLNAVLKEEWGFRGVVMSDWNATHNSKEALLNGLDLEMGTELSERVSDYDDFYLGKPAQALVENGVVKSAVIDEKIQRILWVMDQVHKFDLDRPEGKRNTRDHQNIARQVAEEGMVLLKNEQCLPWDRHVAQDIVVIGANANRKFCMGGGSSQVNAKYEITALEGIQRHFGQQAKISYFPGYKISKAQEKDTALMQQAVAAAKKADKVIFVGGWIQNWFSGDSVRWEDHIFDSEEVDKPDLKLPFHQRELLEQLTAVNDQTAIVLYGGGPVEMSSWLLQAKAVIFAWYPGMEGGNALANILSGAVNPSGKLPMTFPKKLSDNSAHYFAAYPGTNHSVNYEEGIYVGYRFADHKNIDPEFCFGHGLSYTTFEYSDLNIVKRDGQFTVKLTIENTGQQEGKETVQLYIEKLNSQIERAPRELKGFTKLAIKAGERKAVELQLSEEDFQFYDETDRRWKVEKGPYKIHLGASSRDLRVGAVIDI